MSTGSSNMPQAVDSFHDPQGTTSTGDPVYDHAKMHDLANDALTAIEAQTVGILGSPGQANGIAVLGSNAALAVAQGGTGSTTQNFVDLSSAQTIGGNKTFSAKLSVSSLALTTTPTANYVLTSDSSGNATWEAIKIANAGDISLTSLVNNQALVYNSSIGKWDNQAVVNGVSFNGGATQTGTVSLNAVTGLAVNGGATQTGSVSLNAVTGLAVNGGATQTGSVSLNVVTGLAVNGGATQTGSVSLNTVTSLAVNGGSAQSGAVSLSDVGLYGVNLVAAPTVGSPATQNFTLTIPSPITNVAQEVNATNGAITVTLPNATTCSGTRIRIQKVLTDTSNNLVSLVPATGQTIGGASSVVFSAAGQYVEAWSDGANWQRQTQNIRDWIDPTDYGAVAGTWASPSTVDSGPALSAAFAAASASSYIKEVRLPHGQFTVNTPITIGDGTSASPATWGHGLILRGAGGPATYRSPQQGAPYWFGVGPQSTLVAGPNLNPATNWNPILSLQGPISGFGISDVGLYGARVAGEIGLLARAVEGLHSERLWVAGFGGIGIAADSVVGHCSYIYSSNTWVFNDTHLSVPGLGGAVGLAISADTGYTLTTLNAALTSGTAVSSIAVAAGAPAMPARALLQMASGSHTEMFYLTSAVAEGAATWPIASSPTGSSWTPNYSYPVGSTISGTGDSYDMTFYGTRIDMVVAPASGQSTGIYLANCDTINFRDTFFSGNGAGNAGCVDVWIDNAGSTWPGGSAGPFAANYVAQRPNNVRFDGFMPNSSSLAQFISITGTPQSGAGLAEPPIFTNIQGENGIPTTFSVPTISALSSPGYTWLPTTVQPNYLPQLTTPAMPAGTGSTNTFYNNFPFPVDIYIVAASTGGFNLTVNTRGATVSAPAAAASGFQKLRLYPGDSAYFTGTLPASWTWVYAGE